MLVRDLIKDLEALLERHKLMEEMMGPAVIMFDYYEDYDVGEYNYAGIVKDAVIDYTADGVYPVLTAVTEEQKKQYQERLDKSD